MNEEMKALGVAFAEHIDLASHSTFRIGGIADAAFFPGNAEECVKVLAYLRENRLPYTVIGRGSNLLFPDGTWKETLIFTEKASASSLSCGVLFAECGAPLASLARLAAKSGYADLTFACGIPGSIGGAIYMNAGAYEKEIGSLVESVTVFDADTGEIRTLKRDECAFGYRRSIFAENANLTVLSVELSLHEKKETTGIIQEMETLNKTRREKQPLDLPSAGSAFKRPAGHYAGALIEECGLKGFGIGGARISTKHAGFIVNAGGATARDVKQLIAAVQEKVKEETGVELVPEIKFLGGN